MLNSSMFVKIMASLLISLSFAAVFVPGAPGSAAEAEAPEPIAVVSSASYDRWYDNVALIGKISGSPDLAQGLEAMLKIATANRGLAGLDKSRPWAVIVTPSADRSVPYIYLPVTDLAQLLEVIRPFVKGIANDGNTHKIELDDIFHLYVIEQNGWAIVTPEPEALPRAVNDPVRLLGDLPKRYDLAARLYISHFPAKHRTTFLARFNRLDRHERRRPGESDTAYAVRRRLTQLMVEAIIAGIRDLDHITVGCTLDHDARQMSAELVLVAKEETPTARRWSRYRESESDLAGFRLPGAALTSTWAGTLSEAVSDMLVLTVDTAKLQCLRDIDRRPSESVEDVPGAGETVLDLCDATRSLFAGRRLEGTASVVLQPKAATWVSAIHLPAGGKIQRRIEHFASLAQDDPEIETGLERGTDRNGQVRLHTLSFPIVESARNRQTLVELFGQRIDVVLGVGKENLYVAFGHGALKTLKEALAASRTAPAVTVAPLECSVALGPVAEWAAEWAKGRDKLHTALIASSLKQSAGKDHVRLTAGPADGGLRVRIELEEGVLRIAGLAVGMVGAKWEAAGPAAVE